VPNESINQSTNLYHRLAVTGRTPIIWALEEKQWFIVWMLNEKDTNSLHLLLKESHILGEKETLELVQSLVDSEYNIQLSNAGFARVLVSAEPALDSRDNSSKTPLQYAFMKGSEGVI
jgi:hypothetical protein